MTPRSRITLVVATLAALAIPTLSFAAARAELRPGPDLALGAPARLVVTVDDAAADATPPPPPHIANARVRYAGQRSQLSIVNGRRSQQLSFIYTITPTALGPLDVPAISVTTAAGVETTAPMHATVATAPAAPPASPASASTPAAEHAFVRIDVPTRSLVVGQAVPVTIRAYFRGGTSATLQGPPRVTSDAFTLSGLSDTPSQAQVELHGEPYLQATWTGVLSPAKPLTVALGVEIPVELAYRDAVPHAVPAAPAAAPTPRSIDDLFGDLDDVDADPFAAIAQMDQQMSQMTQMFDIGPMQQRDVTLRASAGTLAVADLPTAGRPATFTGAVGHFTIAADPIAGEPRVGEPLTLTVHVAGTGNFDRVDLPGVADAAAWKTYATKSAIAPGAHPTDATKTFTQTIVPTRAGAVSIPPVALAFFDPKTRAYTTVTTAAIPLVIAASAGATTADAGLAGAPPPTAAPTASAASRAPHASLVPGYRRAAWWTLPIGMLALTGALVLLAWSRRSEHIARVLRRRRVDRDVARATAAMDAAARADDAPAFFVAARRAVQTRLADRWHVAREAITPHDIDLRLGSSGATLRELFERADALAYAPAAATREPLERWRALVRDQLLTLETPS